MNHLDERILYFFNRTLRSDFLDAFVLQATDLSFWIVVILVFVGIFFIKERKVRFSVIVFVIAWALADAVTMSLKLWFHRPRPLLTLEWVQALDFQNNPSFPSGHALIAMAYAVILSYHYAQFRFVFYFMALLIGLTRVYMGLHYFSDILAGFAIGVPVGYLSLFLEKRLGQIFLKFRALPKTAATSPATPKEGH